MKVFYLVTVLMLCLIQSEAQIWKDAVPLQSTREDIRRIQPKGQRLENGNSFFKGSDEDITVKYYGGSCDHVDPRFSSRAKNKVLEIQTDLKKEIAVASLLATYVKQFEEIKLSSERKIYIDHQFGYAVVAKASEALPEMAFRTFHLPPSASIPPCAVPELGREIQDAFALSTIFQNQQKKKVDSDVVHGQANGPKISGL